MAWGGGPTSTHHASKALFGQKIPFSEDTMSEERDIVETLRLIADDPQAVVVEGVDVLRCVSSVKLLQAASEITSLRGEAEAREVEITALVESAREAQQLYVQADNEAQRLRGEVERLRETLDELLFENSDKTEVERLVTRLKARDALSSASKPEEG